MIDVATEVAVFSEGDEDDLALADVSTAVTAYRDAQAELNRAAREKRRADERLTEAAAYLVECNAAFKTARAALIAAVQAVPLPDPRTTPEPTNL